MQIDFKLAPIQSAFIQSDARMRTLRGPFGSGKSITCLMEVVRRAKQQQPAKDGIRHSRWAVIRNTMRQLTDTTQKSWDDWFPAGQCGYWKLTGKTFFLEFGDVKAEIMFRALDDVSDVKNLLSLELTGAFINEARETPRAIIEGLQGRIDRYPSKKDGGATWAGIWADTNAPEEGSYWHCMMEGLDPDTGEPRPNNWANFVQPPGMLKIPDARVEKGYVLVPNPDAENIENLPKDYYANLIVDASEEYINVYVLNQYGKSKAGKPVHPLFNEMLHKAKQELIPNILLPLVLTADFGLTPAIALMQQDTFGRLLVLDEIVTENMGLKRCIEERLQPLLRRKYRDFKTYVTGDPSGANGSQNDERSCLEIFRDAGFKQVKLAYSNNPIHRTNDLDTFLSRRTETGSGFLVSPQCVYIIRGLGGAYHYKIAKNGVASDSPEKNIYSHICEAVQYGAMSFGKGSFSAEGNEARKGYLKQVQNRSGQYAARGPR